MNNYDDAAITYDMATVLYGGVSDTSNLSIKPGLTVLDNKPSLSISDTKPSIVL